MATINKETAQIIDWLECEEDSLKCYLDKSREELIEIFSNYMYHSLRHTTSIVDTVLALINITLEDRVDWEVVIKYLETRKQKESEYQQASILWEEEGKNC